MNTDQIRQGRSIHLIDIENQLGTPYCEASRIQAWFQDYARMTEYAPGDLIVMGSSSTQTLFQIHASGITCRKVLQRGRDGADIALLQVMEGEDLSQRFERIYCASGDHAFTDVVSWLGGDAQMIVVSRPSGLSKRLRMAACDVIFMPELQLTQEVA